MSLEDQKSFTTFEELISRARLEIGDSADSLNALLQTASQTKDNSDGLISTQLDEAKGDLVRAMKLIDAAQMFVED